MNDQGTPVSTPHTFPSPTIRAAIVLVVAAVLFFAVHFLDGLRSAFGGFGGTVDHWPFIYVCVPALFAVAFITRRIGRWHGLISTVLFTAFVAWVCWSAATSLAHAYQTGWQDYGAQRWLLVLRWSIVWGGLFALLFCLLPESFFRRTP
jgi:hypothetical protein